MYKRTVFAVILAPRRVRSVLSALLMLWSRLQDSQNRPELRSVFPRQGDFRFEAWKLKTSLDSWLQLGLGCGNGSLLKR